MKTFSAHFTGKDYGTIRSFPSRANAIMSGNSQQLFSDNEDLERSMLTISQMVAFYNYHNSAQPVKTFRDKKTAALRIFNLAQAKAVPVEVAVEPQPTVKETMEKLKKEKAPAPKAKVAEEKSAKRGRKSEFDGARIYPAADVTENPRREGTKGGKGMDIVLANPGITYEDYLAAGARRQDLAWDLNKGFVRIERD